MTKYNEKYNEKYNVELAGYYVGVGELSESVSTVTSQPIGDLNLIKSLNQSCGYINSLPIILFQGFAIFMFNLGLLGGIAFEFFVGQSPKKYEDLNFDEMKINKMRMNEFAGFFAVTAHIGEHTLQLVGHVLHTRWCHDLNSNRCGADLNFDFLVVELAFA